MSSSNMRFKVDDIQAEWYEGKWRVELFCFTYQIHISFKKEWMYIRIYNDYIHHYCQLKIIKICRSYCALWLEDDDESTKLHLYPQRNGIMQIEGFDCYIFSRYKGKIDIPRYKGMVICNYKIPEGGCGVWRGANELYVSVEQQGENARFVMWDTIDYTQKGKKVNLYKFKGAYLVSDYDVHCIGEGYVGGASGVDKSFSFYRDCLYLYTSLIFEAYRMD